MSESHTVGVDEGVVSLYTNDGRFERVICAGAIGAEIHGDEIIVLMLGGKKKIYSIRGFFKRNV